MRSTSKKCESCYDIAFQRTLSSKSMVSFTKASAFDCGTEQEFKITLVLVNKSY